MSAQYSARGVIFGRREFASDHWPPYCIRLFQVSTVGDTELERSVVFINPLCKLLKSGCKEGTEAEMMFRLIATLDQQLPSLL